MQIKVEILFSFITKTIRQGWGLKIKKIIEIKIVLGWCKTLMCRATQTDLFGLTKNCFHFSLSFNEKTNLWYFHVVNCFGRGHLNTNKNYLYTCSCESEQWILMFQNCFKQNNTIIWHVTGDKSKSMHAIQQCFNKCVD